MKDYMALLADKLKSRVGVIFRNTTPSGATKPTKGGSVSFGTASGVVSGKDQGGIAQGFVNSVSTQSMGNPKTGGAAGFILANLKNGNTTPHRLTKLTKPLRPKVWRSLPYWPACVEAAQEGGTLAAQQLYTALAFKYGHTSEEIDGHLKALVPHTQRQRVTPLITAEWAERYVAAHPFAFELKLNARDYYEAAEAA